MKIKQFLALGAMIFGVGLFGASPASAAPGYGTQTESFTDGSNTVTCKTWKRDTPMWPANDLDYWVCTSTVNPTVNFSRADNLINPVVGLNTVHPLYETLTNAPYSYYYFQSRSDANSFMKKKFPGRSGLLESSTARCGNTGTLTGAGGTGTIISMVYETCIYGGTLGSEQNPNLEKTAAHETGHGYDFNHFRLFGHLISESPGYTGLANGIPGVYSGDIFYMKPINWDNGSPNAMTAQQKAALLCGTMFKQHFPSKFERSTGAPNDQVCTNSTTIAPNYVGLHPATIGMMRLPYFLTSGVSGGTPLYRDLFAEQFSKLMPSVPSAGNMLTMTDTALIDLGGFPCKNVAGIYTCDGVKFSPGSAFHCTEWVVRRFYFTDAPPVANTVPSPGAPTPLSLKARGCPDLAPSQF